MSITKKSVDTTNVKLSDKPGTADTEGMTEDTLAPATEVAASGALIEPTIVERIDTAHPSVDNEPRKGATKDMNRIDFNEPSALTPPEEIVEEELKNG
jgi:hypothetical protein